MEINPTSSAAAAASAALDEALPTGELGRDEFLKLLVTKLSNQDPLNPTEDTEFIGQLADFSSLEQLIQVNESIQGLTSSQNELVNSQALTLIGKDAVVPYTDSIQVVDGQPADELIYAVPETLKSATVHLTDIDGNRVASYELDPVAGGRRTLDWDAMTGDSKTLPDGSYGIEIEATGLGDLPGDLLLFQSVNIDGVNLQEGAMQLISQGRVIPYESILEIRSNG